STSGMLRIVDDGTVDLDALLPTSNTDRLVQLSHSGKDDHLQWAFLSAEQYTQDYTARAHELELPLIGVPDAMDSVEIPSTLLGMLPMNYLAGYLLGMFLRTYVNPAMCFVYVPLESVTVWQTRIDTSLLFEEQTIENEDSTETTLAGISYRAALEKLCRLFGYTLAYRGDVMYFRQNMTKDDSIRIQYVSVYVSDFMKPGFQKDLTPVGMSYLLFDALEWRGAGHTRTINAGAKSVEVVAKLAERDFTLSLPDMPLTEADENDVAYGYTYVDDTQADNNLYSLSISTDDFVNTIFYNKYAVHFLLTKKQSGVYYVIDKITVTSYSGMLSDDDPLVTGLDNALSQSIRNSKFTDAVDRWNMYNIEEYYNVSARIAKIEVYNSEEGKKQDLDDGLFVVGAFYEKYDTTTPMLDPSSSNYVARITSSYLGSSNGILMLKFDALFLNAYGVLDTVETNLSYPSLYFALKCGDKWYHPMSRTWTDVFAYTAVGLKDGKIYHSIEIEDVDCSGGYPILLTPDIVGTVELYVYPHIHVMGYPKTPDGNVNYTRFYSFYFFLKDLSLEFRPFTDATKSDKSENKYLIRIGKFREEVSVELDYASDHNNRYSPSIIRVAEEGSMVAEKRFLWYRELSITSLFHPYNLRPELKLLQTLRRYYEKKRETLTLEVALTDEQREGLYKKMLTESEVSGKKRYAVLRDEWDVRQDKHSIDCFETEG
ncbi:MAG: hypothetical protein ACI4TV_03655, partial [Paludibacteraceae bacterium]